MNTCLKHCKIVNAKGASEYGFNIEDDIAFIFDLGEDMVGCLGHVSDGPNSHWQFDTVDADLNAFQFVEPDLHKALEKAEQIAIEMHQPSTYLMPYRLTRLGLEPV